MPVVVDAFAVFFPMVLLLLVAIVLFNLVDRLLSLCRVKQFEFDDHFDDSSIAAGYRKRRRMMLFLLDGLFVLFCAESAFFARNARPWDASLK